MKKILFAAVMLLLAATSCQKLQYPERSSDTTLQSLKCYVYYDPDAPSKRQEVNLLSGKYNEERGLISYTFPTGGIYTSENLAGCRMEATIPSTAVLELMDAAGTSQGHGFQGLYDLRNQTIYFKIIAADGTEKNYQLTCKFSN